MSEEINDQTKEINKCLKESTIIAVAFWALRSARSPHPPIQ
ncbi:hypothetical protein [Nostoc sp.]